MAGMNRQNAVIRNSYKGTGNSLFFLYKKTAMANAIAEKVNYFLFCAVIKVYSKVEHATV